MGIGRFAYTPILPLMTAQAGLTAQAAGHLATANYVGYLGGAVAGTLSHRLARSTIAWRTSLVVLIATLGLMPLASNVFNWMTLRTVAGFASAVVFVVAVNSLLEHLRDHSPHLPGWGFGGVGVGIALSGVMALAMPVAAGWRGAWWTAAARLRSSSALATSARTSASNAAPVGVSVTDRRSRSNKRTFRSRSRALICCESDGPAMRSRSAARPKLSSSATARK
jgi:predicted MFS family arabinose efflux permease